MVFHRTCLAALAVAAFAATAQAAPDNASFKPGMSTSPAPMSAYRRYVKAQADTLVGMTRILAAEIKAGDLDAAQSEYAPAHSFFERLKPIAVMMRDLDRRMDGRADDWNDREADARFSGFHRLEYGLFANHSTAGLPEAADRLHADAQELRRRIDLLDMRSDALAAGAAKLAQNIAERQLGGDEERYSKTDLWDLEANIEGIQQISAALPPQSEPQSAAILMRTRLHVARIDALLEANKDGCGFKTFDQVSTADKAALKAAVAALAEELSALRGTLAMD